MSTQIQFITKLFKDGHLRWILKIAFSALSAIEKGQQEKNGGNNR